MSIDESEKTERMLISIIGAIVGTAWAYAFVTNNSALLAFIGFAVILALIIAIIRGSMRRRAGLAVIKNTCQHCGFQRTDESTKCPECGVDFLR